VEGGKGKVGEGHVSLKTRNLNILVGYFIFILLVYIYIYIYIADDDGKRLCKLGFDWFLKSKNCPNKI
jgi:hypothetical protein